MEAERIRTVNVRTIHDKRFGRVRLYLDADAGKGTVLYCLADVRKIVGMSRHAALRVSDSSGIRKYRVGEPTGAAKSDGSPVIVYRHMFFVTGGNIGKVLSASDSPLAVPLKEWLLGKERIPSGDASPRREERENEAWNPKGRADGQPGKQEAAPPGAIPDAMRGAVYETKKGVPVTDSPRVAAVFGKGHRHVMDTIRVIIKQIQSAEISAGCVWFRESAYHDTRGRRQPMFVMTRDGFSLLAMGLEGEKAMRFKVAFIRQFNAMEKAARAAVLLPGSYPEALRLAAAQAETIRHQREETDAGNLRLAALHDGMLGLSGKASYCDAILSRAGTVATTQVAQDYGMSAVAFNCLLAHLGIQRKVNGQWILYSRHLGKGYVQSRTLTIPLRDGREAARMYTEWTQRGRFFLYGELKKNGYLPLVERDGEDGGDQAGKAENAAKRETNEL